MGVKTPAQIFGDIHMILARRLAGEINDAQCVALIAQIMDTPDVAVVSLDMVRDSERRPDGEGGEPQH
jgi:hypothetical protein